MVNSNLNNSCHAWNLFDAIKNVCKFDNFGNNFLRHVKQFLEILHQSNDTYALRI